jgi:hypothetical protein
METSLIKHDPAYIAIRDEITSVCKYINEAVIDSPEAVAKITEDACLGRGMVDRLEKMRLVETAEPYRVYKEINKRYNDLATSLIVAVENKRGTASRKITAWNAIQAEKQRKIDEEYARQVQEANELQRMIDEDNARKLAETPPDAETGETIVDLIPNEPMPAAKLVAPVVAKAVTDFGSATATFEPQVELIDLALVPMEFHLFNEKEVIAKIKRLNKNKQPIPNIPGLKITMIPVTDFRRK